METQKSIQTRSKLSYLIDPLRSDAPSKFRGLVNLLAATLCTGIILAPFIALLALNANLRVNLV
jgi:hypothetical protein